MIKAIIKLILPKKYHPFNYAAERAINFLGFRVNNGPFKGMQYIDEAFVGFVCHKVIGTYEKEIKHIIEHELKNNYDAIFDLGSAEGYYAVGMAKFGNSRKVVSFEGSEQGRKLQQRLAKLNGVADKIEIHGYCKKEQLKEHLKEYEKVFIICDVDGFELALLDNNHVPGLNAATMLIECHNHCFAAMEKTLIDRFSSTHDHESFSVRECVDYNDYPCPNLYYRLLPKKYKDFPIKETERAAEDTWLYLKPKSKST